jgi:hypothetical protein
MAQSPTETADDKDAGNAETPKMDRFRRLARGLLKVSRGELAEEQRKYEARRQRKGAGPKPRAAKG